MNDEIVCTSNFIIVGQYTIQNLPDGSLWIAHESGEGMQCSKDKLEAWLIQFYAENF